MHSKRHLSLLLASCATLAVWPNLAGAQGTKAAANKRLAEVETDQPLSRDKWFLKGRVIEGQGSSAEKLRHGYLQKGRKREERARESRNRLSSMAPSGALAAAGTSTSFVTSGTGPSWTPLGPAPIISDPTGHQSYGNVTGRVTAVAVDPNDPTGNTVYVGAASGGVWKSTNAAVVNA